jgi:hypothetical protein
MSFGRGKTLLFAAVVALFAAGPAGCAVISGKYVIEESFTDEQVKQIRNNQTTKAEILAWFGPPLAVARQGESLKVPPPGPGKRGSHDVPAEQFFALFAQKHELTKDQIVYYYHDSSLRWAEIVILNGDFPTIPSMRVKKLWVLINEKTGIAEDTFLGKPEKEQDHTGAGPEQQSKTTGSGTGPGELPLWKSGATKP